MSGKGLDRLVFICVIPINKIFIFKIVLQISLDIDVYPECFIIFLK